MWADKIVVVAGGSRGLGVHIAREFHSRGAIVVLLARSRSGIESVVEDFNTLRAESSIGFAIDLSDDDARASLIEKLVEQFGRIDVWVNAVGQSTRSKFSESTIAEYRQLMEQNFFVSVGCSLDVLPYLEKSSGYLINIGSLSAKTAWKYLGPYVSSKHALAGFAHQLRIEGPENVHSLFVCPGPIRNSDLSRYAASAENLDELAAKPGAGAPVKAIAPEWLGKKIVDSCEHGKTELVIPLKSRILFAVTQLWPSLGDRLIKKFCK